MFRTGMPAISLVNMLNGAVSFGAFGFSPFPAFAFFDLGTALGRGFSSIRGELDGAIVRPLRVRLERSSFSVADLGVGGEPENMVWLLFCLSAYHSWVALSRTHWHATEMWIGIVSGPLAVVVLVKCKPTSILPWDKSFT